MTQYALPITKNEINDLAKYHAERAKKLSKRNGDSPVLFLVGKIRDLENETILTFDELQKEFANKEIITFSCKEEYNKMQAYALCLAIIEVNKN